MRLCVKKFRGVAGGVFCHVCHSGAVIENPCMSFENDIQDIHGSYAHTPVTKIQHSHLLTVAFLFSYKFYVAMLTYGEFAFLSLLCNMFLLKIIDHRYPVNTDQYRQRTEPINGLPTLTVMAKQKK